jgi:hypothetical protein
VAKAAIKSANCAEDYILIELNIEDEPALLKKYRNDIPVVTINGVEAFRHRVNSDEFRRRLAEQKSLTSHC